MHSVNNQGQLIYSCNKVLLFCQFILLGAFLCIESKISSFIIWPCLKMIGNNQIQELGWLKWILTVV